jgi:phage gp36-like protein
MPPYADRDKVREIISRSAPSRPGTAASLSDAQVDEAILAAGRKIDARLATLYSVPFDPVPQLVSDIATAFAVYDLDLTFREVRDYGSELNPVLLRFKNASDLLEMLAVGKATLPDYEAPEEPTEPPDNPNDGGSIVSIENPCLPDFHWHTCPDPRTAEYWSQW